jgi:hypothetical protein
MTSRNTEEDTWQPMPSPKRIFSRGFNKITNKQANETNQDSPLLFDEIQPENDEGLGGLFPGTISDGLDRADKHAPTRTAAPRSKDLS